MPVGKAIDCGTEILGQSGERARIAGVAHRRISIARVDARERVHQAANVGAYSKIAYAARINDDVAGQLCTLISSANLVELPIVKGEPRGQSRGLLPDGRNVTVIGDML